MKNITWEVGSIDRETSTVSRGEYPDVTFEVSIIGRGYGDVKSEYPTRGSFERALSIALNGYASPPKIEKVIFNNPATIILWTDGSKTVVKCQPGDIYSKEVGFITAYLKKLLGNDNTFNKEINKWVPKETPFEHFKRYTMLENQIITKVGEDISKGHSML